MRSGISYNAISFWCNTLDKVKTYVSNTKRLASGLSLKLGSPYREIDFWRSTINKAKARGFDPKFLIYRLKWNVLKKVPLNTSVPVHVDIETASACNLKCTMCPHGIESYDGPRSLIKDELARKIIKDCIKSGVTSLKLSGRGEALMHPHLVDYVKMAKAGGIIDVMLNTNALLLTKEKASQLVDAGIDLIVISMDGTTKEIYELIRSGSDFETVVNNIEYLIQYKKEIGSPRPMIRLQFIKMKENIHQYENFIRKWEDKVDVLVGLEYSERGTVNQEEKHVEKKKRIGRAYCPHPFQRLSIDAKGQGLMCCVDWYGKYVVGDCHTQSIKEIWKSRKIEYGRECIERLEHHKISSCKECWSAISYKWE